MALPAILLALLQAAAGADAQTLGRGAADPAFSRNGRLVVSIRGDLWIRQAAGERWIPATQGPSWDWEATWDPDGTAIVFVSDRSGNPDLWRVRIGPEGPRALAATSDAELETVVHDLLRQRPLYGDSAAGWGAVSSAHPVATAAGLEMLRRGGNVVDATVAVSFALGVVEPDASGLGGYGQMLLALAGAAEPALIEFMTRVPEDAALSNAALLQNGRYPDDGPVLANVPGTVAAMELAWRKYGGGKLKWSELLEPAIRAAEQGFEISDGFATTLAVEREHFLKYAGSRALFFPGGEPLPAGDTLRNPDLAWTLRQIAEGGARAFYQGEVARRLVTDLHGHGNAIRMSDLARYYAVEREPVTGTYRGYAVYSSTPPSGGGATLIAQLNHLEQLRDTRPFPEDATTLHAMIESWKLVPAGRGRIADPGLWPVRLDAFVSKDSARARWGCFAPTRSLTPQDVSGDRLSCVQPAARVSPEAGRPDLEVEPCDGHCHHGAGGRRGRECVDHVRGLRHHHGGPGPSAQSAAGDRAAALPAQPAPHGARPGVRGATRGRARPVGCRKLDHYRLSLGLDPIGALFYSSLLPANRW